MVVPVGAQLRKGVAEYCILGLLAREQMYGWQLSEALSKPGLIASIGTLYPILSRLRERGLIASFEQDTGSGPVRKYYRLTGQGESELERFREQWGPFVAAVTEIVGEVGDDEH
ncbi:PadR family transcriptional regulator [Microbacterium caowuchunii]|jgi:PadR family transcriptional regulator, regulatory protein PadR|uniref:PadR family transcriptional regulator n=1 Tax=Microbacterium caowuchunii TaxID=2614638 RepID=UPI001245970C|nr:PadR family transcriptional regulator [Microbacterium caowuchunii]QEV99707.1 PadR family transcriptional regulator [Microbacterium caowuchunii]